MGTNEALPIRIKLVLHSPSVSQPRPLWVAVICLTSVLIFLI